MGHRAANQINVKIAAIAGGVLVAGGVILGVVLAGGGSTPTQQVRVQTVDQPVVVVSSSDVESSSVAAVAPVALPVPVASTSSVVPAPSSSVKVAPKVTEPTKPGQWGPSDVYVTDPAVIGNGDGQRPTPLLLPAAPTTDVVIPNPNVQPPAQN